MARVVGVTNCSFRGIHHATFASFSLPTVVPIVVSRRSPMYLRSAQLRKFVVAAGIAPLGVFYGFGAVSASASPSAIPGPGHGNGTFEVRQILSGTALHHSFTPAGTTVDKTEPLSDPDDITRFGGDLFVGFQNGVGPQGQASSDGN